MPPVRLGAHVSTAGGMPNAVLMGRELECEAIQVFTRNQRQWEPKPLQDADIAEFRREARAEGYLKDAVSHASYLINLCAIDDAILAKSRRAFEDEIRRCGLLGIPYLCIHPGSHLKAGEEEGLRGIADSLRVALAATKGIRVKILLENTAGQGTNLGYRFEHLATLLRAVKSKRLGVCIDTCHMFAAGYDLRTKKAYEASMKELDDTVGIARVHAFHLNDSKFGCGEKRDRHENIGEGKIGRTGFLLLVNDPRFDGLPGLLETPGGPDGYAKNLRTLRRMRDS
ncbi:MAG: deoxyribonuclease IV [Planctomycetota bacterium]|jgi:deoxyribonuclease-4